MNNENKPPPPSPQPEEKDMQVYELNVVLYSLIRFAQRVVNKYPDEFKDGKDRIEKAQYIASKYHKPEDTLRIVQSAPPTQSDQEAAERLRPKGVNRGVRWKEGFVAGCNHVRGQQQEDAVAFAEWASWNNWVYQPETKKWFNKDLFMKEEAKDKTTADLYALFTARHPTPKPGSQGIKK